ncbi:MAG TPA: KH domain-containing protein [Candidatus Saccharimonadales bacterium]|nr:KH domain-containing protein [Candidatus Saccharimonadales bacterium]
MLQLKILKQRRLTVSSIDQQFIEFIVKSLVEKPDAVKVERKIDERGVLLELTVDPEDLGRVIGKRGSTAQSLRSLLRALGTKNDARYNLKIVDVDRPNGEASTAKTSDGPSDNDVDNSQDEPVEKADSDRVKNTRKELAELDDLDI